MPRHVRAALALAVIVALLAAGVTTVAILAPATGIGRGPLGVLIAGGLIVAALYLSWDVVEQIRNHRH